jgi:prepilin-type N-terminal cleavage/methylation domain-containing protein/prepilin-type processing-associated H-X9-DG protein
MAPSIALCRRRVRQRPPRGFTLIELLVVIAIVGVLVALLLPAAQAARESARRIQCTNNLKQIGVAIQSFHDTSKYYPSAYQSQPGGAMGAADPDTGDAGPGWTFLVQIMPFLELENVRESLDLKSPSWSPTNAEAVQRSIPGYCCPSVSDASITYEVKDAGGTVLAVFSRAHYVACAGRLNVWDNPAANLTPFADGVLFRNSRIRMQDVSDGTSRTIFVGEQTPLHSDSTWVGIVPGATTCPGPDFPFGDCDLAAPQINMHSGPGDELPSVILPPNTSGDPDAVFSEHSGGCNVLFGDGSVRFISEMINQLVWSAMASRAGNEVEAEEL